ncbi:cysteine proteinase [Poronia punctata]|nr:cysteine proteinase [Poronia punctata]
MSPGPNTAASVASSSGTQTSSSRSNVHPSKAPDRSATYNRDSGSGKAPFRHIDDIVSVSIDIDPYTPLRKVLEIGDAHMQQAITFNDFDRPDLALQEYIKAFTIAVDKIPKHKDYPSLKSDRGVLNRQYQALKVKITRNGAIYDRIKEKIKEDNSRSGVVPEKVITRSPANATLDFPRVPLSPPPKRSVDNHRGSSTNGHTTRAVTKPSDDNGYSGTKPKPSVLPKPLALHGNPRKPGPEKTTSDLAARFARLRDPQEPDAIRSLSPVSRPAGSKTGQSSQRPAFSLDNSVPAMPKVPDAIYSPVRGTVTSEAANLPSSTPRGMFSRTNSIVSNHTSSPRQSLESLIRPSNGERFVAAHTYGESQGASAAKANIPAGDVITVSELVHCMGSGSTNLEMLLIDVRDRQSFDDGHIMSQNTICLDPTVLCRENISADDIVDSMILAPPSEKIALERRDEVELVVFYDQNSTSLPERRAGSMEEAILQNLRLALMHYSYPKQLKHTPKLLAGGIDAWVDEMGRHSLQTSITQSIVRHGTSKLTGGRQRLRNRTLGPDEVNTFEAMIGRDEEGDFDYAKSREDFMRRFPSLKEPESMVSSRRSDTSEQTTASGKEEFFLKDIAPMPPVRPKPSVARTRYSGLESGDENLVPGGTAKAGTTQSQRKPTGLVNIGNWCYANASIQALLASPGFVDEFLDSSWPTKYRPKVDPGNPAYNQLLCKILGNLFQWLSKRYFVHMKAATLMHYLRSIHTGYVVNGQTLKFGDTNQHDSDEFITFIFGQLEVETRIELDRVPSRSLDTSRPVDFMVDAWANRNAHNLISRHWYSMELHTLTCKNCKAENFMSSLQERYILPVPMDGVTTGQLETALRNHFLPEEVATSCDACGSTGKTWIKQMARLPPLLRVYIQRGDETGSVKLKNDVVFPFDNLDLGPYALGMNQRAAIAGKLSNQASEGFRVTPRYRLRAVVLHEGPTLHSGHYIAYVRGDNKYWTRCEDAIVQTNAEDDSSLLRSFTTSNRSFTPVQLFYERIDRLDERADIYGR